MKFPMNSILITTLKMKIKDCNDMDDNWQANLLYQRAYTYSKIGVCAKSSRLFVVHFVTDGRADVPTTILPGSAC